MGYYMNIEAFKSLGHLKQFTTNDIICTEKEEGDTAYLLLQGMVDIVRDAHLKTPEQIADELEETLEIIQMHQKNISDKLNYVIEEKYKI